MKVLHVVNISFVLPYYLGEQLNYFQKKGYKIYVACSPSDHLVDFCNKKNLHFLSTRINREITPFQDLYSIFKLIRFIKKNRIDMVVGHTPKAALIAMIASFLSNVSRRIYFRHGLMFETSTGFRKKLFILVEKLTSILATKVICVSKSVLQKSNLLIPLAIKKTTILHWGTCNGVDAINKYNPDYADNGIVESLKVSLNISSNDLVVGYVGRLVRDKGIIELVKAWKKIVTNNQNLKLLLVGPFEDRDALDEQTKKIILNDNSIIFTGLVQDTFPFYCLMDVFILPSYREGFPTVVLEGSSMKLPIITTKSTGCIDSILENETGIFTDINESDIEEKIKYYIYNKDIAIQHGINGRNFVLDNFQQEYIWNEIEKNVLN